MLLSLDNVLLSFIFFPDYALQGMCISFPSNCPTVSQPVPDLSLAALLRFKAEQSDLGMWRTMSRLELVRPRLLGVRADVPAV